MKSILSIFAIFLLASIVFLFGYINKEDNSFAFEENQKLTETLSASDQYKIIKLKDKVLLDIPVISQFPELARGCEVTSLSMLLLAAGINKDKMALASEIEKDPTPQSVVNGKVYFGNPHKGFVGNIYTYDQPGLGVYVEPIVKLAEKYLPGKIVNLTNSTFEDLKIYLSDKRPVWVIINTKYQQLSDSYFKTWYTEEGPIRVTSKEHSVLVTGYDKEYIYFNDPLTGTKNKKAPIVDFKKAWVQMGSQAITFQN
ncbi:C39 family peptidase [Heyndrickxia oleronia]|uniref:C39 family peptidase n=1 Tax=Heyndrickxia oleronia TaxID=38875 RepID=UPI00099133A1|nr:C39 family peptidase [Heyndrickxia oleronia]MEC1374120.1 C39 family peptidase [Heyndrickxia oleronia]NYV64251.1 C39 family peptidase [Bacillus sp. Gen3]QQZ06290.1 C39 family peptidase [Heyndrickxia oleronia]